MKKFIPHYPQIKEHIGWMYDKQYSYSHVVNNSLGLEHYTRYKGTVIKLARPKKPRRLIKDVLTESEVSPYLLIVDEAERLFQTEMAKQFVITCYRTWRKFNSGIWSLSQNYKDFLSDKNLKDSLLPNTTSLIILRQRKIDWDDFQKTFDFNDAQMNSIKSLEIIKRKYSEFYYLQDERDALLRLSPDPLSYWICTSDPNDKAAIEEMKKKYPEKNMLEILLELSKTG